MKNLIIIAILLFTLEGQPRTATLQSYFQARELLDKGIEAIGGEQALRQTKTVRRDLTGDWLDTGQGHRPWRGKHGELPPSHEYDEVLTFADYAANRWFESLKYSPSKANPEHVIQMDVIEKQEGFSALQYMKEKPFLREVPAEEVGSLRTRKFRRFPERLLMMAVERAETLQWIGTGDESGRKQQVLSFADAIGTRISLYFDAQTHLLTKTEVLRDHPVAGDTNTEVLYLDYRPVGELKLPFRYIDRIAGVATQDWHATSIQLNVVLPEERFRAPLEMAVIEKDPPQPKLERLGDNLYLVRAAYNVLFALFRDFVLIFEAPAGSRHSEDVRQLIRSVAPGKPVRGVIATHFHFDHIAGVRTYVAENIPIFTTPDAKEVIEQSVMSEHTMRADLLSEEPKTARIEAVSGLRVFDDGVNRVELYDFGPTQHVAQNLVAYFPAEGILFQADMWDVPSRDLFVAGRDGAILALRIGQFGLNVNQIIPVHGIPATSSDLKQALANRKRYFPVE